MNKFQILLPDLLKWSALPIFIYSGFVFFAGWYSNGWVSGTGDGLLLFSAFGVALGGVFIYVGTKLARSRMNNINTASISMNDRIIYTIIYVVVLFLLLITVPGYIFQ